MADADRTIARQIVRHIDTWHVLKMSVLVYLAALIVTLGAGVILWNLAGHFGIINNLNTFIKTVSDTKTFTLEPPAALAVSAAIGTTLATVGTLANVTAATLYNLISDVTGGVSVIVVAEPDWT